MRFILILWNQRDTLKALPVMASPPGFEILRQEKPTPSIGAGSSGESRRILQKSVPLNSTTPS